MSRINVAVALRDDAREWIFEIAAACRALGLKHASTLRNVGVLTGSVEVEDLPKLRAIPGVLAVEPKRGSRMNGTPPGTAVHCSANQGSGADACRLKEKVCGVVALPPSGSSRRT
jgi:hypothetical protein